MLKAKEKFTIAKGWTMTLIERISQDNLSLVSAGVAFYIFLAIFPAIATSISLYGLLADTSTINDHIARLANFVPADVLSIISKQVVKLNQNAEEHLTMGVLFGILLSLWSANKAMKAIKDSLNIAYRADEDRGIIAVNAITLALTLFSSIVFIIAISVIVFVPIFISFFITHQSAEILTTLGSWTLFCMTLLGMFVVLYRFAPAKHFHTLKELVPGATFSTVFFVFASIAFSIYVSNFGKYDEQYGALGAVVVMMMWFFIGAFIFLVGAEINAINAKNRKAAINEKINKSASAAKKAKLERAHAS